MQVGFWNPAKGAGKKKGCFGNTFLQFPFLWKLGNSPRETSTQFDNTGE